MKKILSFLILLAVLTALFAGCGSINESIEEVSQTEESQVTTVEQPKATVRLGGLKGPTSIGMVKLLDDSENGKTKNNYEFTMAGSADEITPKFLSGDLDIVAVPVNLGSVLYNKSNGKIQMMAINTLGVLYIVEKGTSDVQSLSDLKGKTIYATGKGSTPEYVLTYLLSQYDIDINNDLTVEWKSEPTEVVSQMASMDSAVAMLPQPYVTVAQNQLEGLSIACDLTKVWDDLGVESKFITAGIFVRKEFAENNPDVIKDFLDEYSKSTDYANENVEEVSELVEKYDIIKAAIAKKAIPYCNVVCIEGSEMIAITNEFLNVLFGMNPSSVGEKLPGEDFYLK